jgi:murein DD-endopeptidase MepM/ murein hydrolase activator NlpD
MQAPQKKRGYRHVQHIGCRVAAVLSLIIAIVFGCLYPPSMVRAGDDTDPGAAPAAPAAPTTKNAGAPADAPADAHAASTETLIKIAAAPKTPPVQKIPAKHVRMVRMINVLDPEDCAPANSLIEAGVTISRPLTGVVSQAYAWQHAGLDVMADPGTMVTAAHDGEVIFSGWSREGYGYLVTIMHPPIIVTSPVTMEVQLKTHYAHLKQGVVVEGAQIKTGQTIGSVGSTGYASGPHLHFEVRLDSIAMNPMCFWPLPNIRGD